MTSYPPRGLVPYDVELKAYIDSAPGSGAVQAGAQPGQTLRPTSSADPTAWKARGPYELWLEDFGTGGNITYAVGSPVTSGDNCAPFLDALWTKANTLNPNRGGVTMRLDRQRYWIGTQPANITIVAPTVLGTGVTGFDTSGRGCTQLIVANGVTGLPFVSASHAVIGPELRNFHIYGDTGTATGSGILLKNFDGFRVDHVAASNFPGGTALDIDGGSGDAQYGVVNDFRGGGSAKEIRLHGAAPNGVRIIAPRLEGNAGSGTPIAGSVGISIETGDTCRIYAPVVSGYAIGIDHQAVAHSCEVVGMRGEYNNRHVRLGATSRGFFLDGGSFDDNLLPGGATSIGVDIVAGATGYVLRPIEFQLSKAGFVEINGHVLGNGTVDYSGMLSFQARSAGTGTYTVTNPSTDRALNVTADTLAQTAAVLGTLISDLQTRGLIG